MTKTTYIVTDPCYILDSDTWSNICNQCKDEDFYNGTFNQLVADELTKLTGSKAYVSQTGFGDWSNTLIGKVVNDGNFCADAGMVCVCKLDSSLLTKYPMTTLKELGAIFEAEGEINVEFNTTVSDWTEIYITDSAGNRWNSLPAMCEEDEDEYDYDDYDYE
jgi:hypothetical protein